MHEIAWRWETHFSLDSNLVMVLLVLIVVGLWGRIAWRARRNRRDGGSQENVSQSVVKADAMTDVVIALAGTSALLVLLWGYS